METIIVVAVVAGALAAVAWFVYRSLTGKSKCGACGTCNPKDCDKA